MAGKFISERNLKFLLYEVFNVDELTGYPYYDQHNRKLIEMVLDAGMKLAKDIYYPILEEMDRTPPEMTDGRVKVHPSVRDIMSEAGEGGWIASNFPLAVGGEQLPHIVAAACRFIFSAAN